MSHLEHIVAIFADRSMADKALTELNKLGFDHEEVSVLARDHEPDTDIRMYAATAYPEVRPESDTAYREGPIDPVPVVNPDQNEYIKNTHDVADKDPSAMKKDALTGTIIGTGIGLSAILIPGLGPIVAGGAITAAIAATATWAAVGTSIGMLIGLLKDIRIPEDRAELYKAEFEKGNFLIIVQPIYSPSSRAPEAFEILKAHKPKILDEY